MSKLTVTIILCNILAYITDFCVKTNKNIVMKNNTLQPTTKLLVH